MTDEKPSDNQGDKPEIVVDEDWKSQAQAEKDKLSEEPPAGEAAAAPGAGAAAAAEGAPETPLPPASFASLVSGLVTQIFFALGAIEDPQTGQRYRNLPLAKHHIDTLAILEDKTQGNLSDDEKQLLDKALYEVRMQYVASAQGA